MLLTILGCPIALGDSAYMSSKDALTTSRDERIVNFAPVMNYVADIEPKYSAPQGSWLKIVFCFAYVGTDDYSQHICPRQPFLDNFSKISVTLPEGVKWVSVLSNPNIGAAGGTGFNCTSDSQFITTISSDRRSIMYSGFNCAVDLSIFESTFALGGFAVGTIRVNNPVFIQLKSEVKTKRNIIRIKPVNNFTPIGYSGFPLGMPCLALVPQGVQHCWIK